MKKIISLLLVLAMMLCLVACGGKDKTPDTNEGEQQGTTETKVTYTVRVIDESGNAVDGVKITITPKGGTAVPFPTKDGVVEYKTAKEITAAVTELPDGYEYDNLNKALSFDENGMAIVVIAKKQSASDKFFVITVVDQNGDPVVGASVTMCDTSNLCKPATKTGEDGTASYAFSEGEYKARIISLPEGYTVENIEEYRYFEDGKVSFTVTKN